jgi:hypothetical protein
VAVGTASLRSKHPALFAVAVIVFVARRHEWAGRVNYRPRSWYAFIWQYLTHKIRLDEIARYASGKRLYSYLSADPETILVLLLGAYRKAFENILVHVFTQQFI